MEVSLNEIKLQMRDADKFSEGMSKGVGLMQELVKRIPEGSEDAAKLAECSFEELKKLAEKYGIEI